MVAILDPRTKHLHGQHDQQSHGNRDGISINIDTSKAVGLRGLTEIPKVLSPLIDEGQKYDNFQSFEIAYLAKGMSGRYWHITGDRDFTIKKITPTDYAASPMTGIDESALQVSNDPHNWIEQLPDRGYIAEIDLSKAKPNRDYAITNRGFGHEIYITNLDSVSVKRTVTLKSGLAMSSAYWGNLQKYIIDTSDLKVIWEVGRELKSKSLVLSKKAKPGLSETLPSPRSRVATGAAAQVYIRESTSGVLSKLTSDYIAGKMPVPRGGNVDYYFGKRYREVLRSNMLTSYVAGLRANGVKIDKPSQMTRDQFTEFLKLYDTQEKFFTRFHLQMLEKRYKGELLGAQEINRSRMYGSATDNAFNTAKITALGEKASDYEVSWHLRPSEHCTDCLRLARESPYALDELHQVPGDSQTICRNGCRCYLVFKKKPQKAKFLGVVETKHLPGQHDQQSHGNRDGGHISRTESKLSRQKQRIVDIINRNETIDYDNAKRQIIDYVQDIPDSLIQKSSMRRLEVFEDPAYVAPLLEKLFPGDERNENAEGAYDADSHVAIVSLSVEGNEESGRNFFHEFAHSLEDEGSRSFDWQRAVGEWKDSNQSEDETFADAFASWMTAKRFIRRGNNEWQQEIDWFKKNKPVTTEMFESWGM